MQYLITGIKQGKRVERTAESDFMAYFIVGQMNQDGVSDISMDEVPTAKEIGSIEEKKNSLARMRTVAQVVEYFKEEDPESGITEYYLRGLIKQKKIPVLHAGRKSLINLDKLVEYLNCGIQDINPESVYGNLRKVCE